jgi:hypothetical protein
MRSFDKGMQVGGVIGFAAFAGAFFAEGVIFPGVVNALGALFLAVFVLADP